MNLVGSLALPWLTGLAFWALLAPLAALVHGSARPLFVRLAPHERSMVLFALAMLAPVVAALVAALGFAPAIGGWIVDRHCHPDTGCAAHVPALHAGATATFALGAALAAATGAVLWRVARRLRRAMRLSNVLVAIAEPSRRERFETVDSAKEFAYCVGFLRPKVVLSRGLIERLSPQQLRVVLSHEHAHGARRDNLRHWLAALALLPLPPRHRTRLLEDLVLASEQACDREAVESAGGADIVIETLATLRPAAAAVHCASLCARGTTVASRIGALRAPSTHSSRATHMRALIATTYGVAALATTYVAHHGTELVLGLLS